jgi:hypothetical protein
MRLRPSPVLLLALFLFGCVSPPAGVDGGSEPPLVTIEFSDHCAPLAPCEGDPTGTWIYESACVDPANLWPGIRDFCPQATISDLEGTLSGTLTVGSTEVVSRLSSSISGTISLPAACLTHGADCSYIRDALVELTHASVYCAGSSACECSLSGAPPWPMSGELDVSGSTFIAGQRTYDYCLAEGTLTLQETTSDDPDPASYTLRR